MKKIVVVISLVFLVSASALVAQTNAKLGYIDSGELMQMMPGKDTVEARLTEYKASLDQTSQVMYQEYQSKLQDYQNNVATMSQIIRQTKERELNDLQTRIETFMQSAESDFQRKQGELFLPITTRAKGAIDAVAKENGYTYIFDLSVRAVIYFETGENILPLVKTKLGIK